MNQQTKSIISFCHSTSENEPVVYIICLQPGQTFVKFLAICLQFWVRSHRYCDKKFIQEASLCSVYCPVHFCTADCYCYFYTRIRDSALLGKVTRYRRASDRTSERVTLSSLKTRLVFSCGVGFASDLFLVNKASLCHSQIITQYFSACFCTALLTRPIGRENICTV